LDRGPFDGGIRQWSAQVRLPGRGGIELGILLLQDDEGH
jgi:hypothetical protein